MEGKTNFFDAPETVWYLDLADPNPSPLYRYDRSTPLIRSTSLSRKAATDAEADNEQIGRQWREHLVIVADVDITWHAEVGDLNDQRFTDEAVAGGQVAVYEVLRRQVLHSAGHLRRHVNLIALQWKQSRFVMVTTMIRLRFDGPSTAIRLLIESHWGHNGVTR